MGVGVWLEGATRPTTGLETDTTINSCPTIGFNGVLTGNWKRKRRLGRIGRRGKELGKRKERQGKIPTRFCRKARPRKAATEGEGQGHRHDTRVKV